MSRTLIVEADGGSRGNPGVAGYGAVVRDPETSQVLVETAGYLGDDLTNNVAEYRGLMAGVEAALALDPKARLDIRLDSKLVVSQMTGVWKIKHAQLRELAAQAQRALTGVKASFTWVPRSDNAAADALANRAMDTGKDFTRVMGDAPDKANVSANEDSGMGAGAEPVDLAPTSVVEAVRAAQAAASGSQRHLYLPVAPTTLIMIRHGMTPDTVNDVFAGSNLPGPGLSALGKGQARAAAAELERMLDVPWQGLERPVVLYASPTARTLETAQPVAEALGLPVQVYPGFVEQDFGQWDALTKAQVDLRWPGQVEQWYRDTGYVPPGGESRDQVGSRVGEAISRLVAAHQGQTVVVVAHTMVIRAALGAALGAPPAAWFAFRVAPGSLSVIRFWQLGYTEVVCTNRTVALESS